MSAARTAGAITVTGHDQLAAWQARALPRPEQVRPGLWSVAVPIPNNPLRYTLSYAFLGDSEVVVVDPGWDTGAGRAALTTGLAAAGANIADITGVVLTHIHPDHHGLSGWVREVSGAWVAMHPAEEQTLPTHTWGDLLEGGDRRWLSRHGVPADDLDAIALSREEAEHGFALVAPDRYLNDGDRVPVDGRDVRTVWTPGHTPGHLCLNDAEAGVLLTGDHLLPRITPNIGVHDSSDDDPLTAYLDSLRHIAAYRDEEVLPAHEYRFRGADVRAEEIIAHHAHRGDEVLVAVDTLAAPTTFEVAAELTWARGWPALHGFLRRMALAETISHLRHLVTGGLLEEPSGDPLRWRRSA